MLEKSRRKIIPQLTTWRARGTSHTGCVHEASVAALCATLRSGCAAEVLAQSSQGPSPSSAAPGEWSPRRGVQFSAPCFQAGMVCPALPPQQTASEVTVRHLRDGVFKTWARLPTLPSPVSQLDGFQGPRRTADQRRGRDPSLLTTA